MPEAISVEYKGFTIFPKAVPQPEGKWSVQVDILDRDGVVQVYYENKRLDSEESALQRSLWYGQDIIDGNVHPTAPKPPAGT